VSLTGLGEPKLAAVGSAIYMIDTSGNEEALPSWHEYLLTGLMRERGFLTLP
jgi:hypothetical protein